MKRVQIRLAEAFKGASRLGFFAESHEIGLRAPKRFLNPSLHEFDKRFTPTLAAQFWDFKPLRRFIALRNWACSITLRRGLEVHLELQLTPGTLNLEPGLPESHADSAFLGSSRRINEDVPRMPGECHTGVAMLFVVNTFLGYPTLEELHLSEIS